MEKGKPQDRNPEIPPPRPWIPWVEVVAALLLVLGIAAVGSGLWLAGRVDSPDLEALIPYMPGLLAGQAVLTGAVGWILARRRLTPGERRCRLAWPPTLAAGVGVGLLAFALSFAIGWLQSWLGVPVEEQEVIVAILDDPWTKLRALPSMILFAPIAEEIFFRGYAFRVLNKASGFVPALLGSSLLFALIHFNPSGVPIYFTLGLVLGWLCRWSGGVTAPAVGHVVFNAAVLAASA